MLEARNISIEYGSCAVVSGVSLALEAGKILALVGANGAGKTTVLKALNGAVALGSGAVLLDGKPLGAHSRREIARRVAVVAQETETRFPISVLEYVLAGRFAHGGAFGWESERDLQIAADSLADCDLAGYERRELNRLSGGERQRVVLARALATGAGILLLDEPTNNLDLAHQALTFRLVRERCRSCAASAALVTHDLNLAAEFADELVLLKNGRVAARGGAEEVLTEEILEEVFGVRVLIDENPVSRKRRVTMIY